MAMTHRKLLEIVQVTRDCEIGKEGERAVVAHISQDNLYMTLVFVNRAVPDHVVHTGSDYRFVKTTNVAQGVK